MQSGYLGVSYAKLLRAAVAEWHEYQGYFVRRNVVRSNSQRTVGSRSFDSKELARAEELKIARHLSHRDERSWGQSTCYAARRARRAFVFVNLSSMGAAVILIPSAASTLTTVENSGLPLSLRAL